MKFNVNIEKIQRYINLRYYIFSTDAQFFTHSTSFKIIYTSGSFRVTNQDMVHSNMNKLFLELKNCIGQNHFHVIVTVTC